MPGAHYCASCFNPVERGRKKCACCGATRDGTWPDDLHYGRVLEDRYRIDLRVSADGMSITFRATCLDDDTPAVLKMLNPDRAEDPEVWHSFVDQVQAAQDVDSQVFADILYIGMDMEHGDVPYLVHELVRGETLADLLARDLAFDVPEALAITRHMAQGLLTAHGSGLVHRHLRPEKVVVQGVRESTPVRILDLGFASISPKEEVTTPDLVDALRYMPPEQDEGAEDPRTDVYALGVMLFEMIAGRPPHASKGPGTTAGDLIRLKDLVPSIPGELDKLVHVMMARDPSRRPRGMKSIIEQIDKIDDELSTETLDSLLPGGAKRASSPPALVQEPSVGKPSPAFRAPAEGDGLMPRPVIGGERYSAEVFNRPTKPPVPGKKRDIPEQAIRKKPPRKPGRNLATVLEDSQRETRAAPPPPPVDIEPEVVAADRGQLRVELDEEPEVGTAPAISDRTPPPAITDTPPPEERDRRRPVILWIGALGGLLLLLATIVVIARLAGPGGEMEHDPAPAAGGMETSAGPAGPPEPSEEPPAEVEEPPAEAEEPPAEAGEPPVAEEEPVTDGPTGDKKDKKDKKDKEKDRKPKDKKWELLFTETKE